MSNQALVVMTEEQLRTIVRDEVRTALRESPATSGDWVQADEVAAWLGVKRETLRTLVKRDGLPVHRAGKAYVFKRAEVEEWIEQRVQKAGAHARRHGASLRAIRGG